MTNLNYTAVVFYWLLTERLMKYFDLVTVRSKTVGNGNSRILWWIKYSLSTMSSQPSLYIFTMRKLASKKAIKPATVLTKTIILIYIYSYV